MVGLTVLAALVYLIYPAASLRVPVVKSATSDQPRSADSASEKTPFWHWFSRHNSIIEASRQEAKLRELGVLQDGEHVEHAFKVGGDKTFLTNRRVILRWKKMWSPKREYKSLPYSSIKAWSVETTGRWPDLATRLRLFPSAPGLGIVWKAFRKGRVDIFQFGRYLGEKLLKIPMQEARAMSNKEIQNTADDFWAWLGGDLIEVDAQEVEQRLRQSAPFLGAAEHEHVQKAFQVGQALYLFTTHRVIMGDVMGHIWQRSMRYTSIPWEHVRAFNVRTAGGLLDFDNEICLWTDIPRLSSFCRDLRKERVDLSGILSYLSQRLLLQTVNDTQVASPVPDTPQRSSWGDWLAWLGQDFSRVDPAEIVPLIDEQMPGLLMRDEVVNLAYRVWRDMVLLTSLRILYIDVQWQIASNPKISYTSLPWTSVRAFSVRSVGRWDIDSEFRIWTNIPPPPCGDDSCPSGMAFLNVDMRRGRANMTEIGELVGKQVLGEPPAGTCNSPALPPGSAGENFFDWILGDMREIPAAEAQKMFCDQGVLQSDEVVELAFKLRRDTTLFTNKRLVVVDVETWWGVKAEVRSMPYASVRAFEVISAGGWLDRDHDLRMYSDIWWWSTHKQEFRKDRVDIFKVHTKLMEKVGGLGLPQGSPSTTSLSALGARKMAAVQVKQESSSAGTLVTGSDVPDASLMQGSQHANSTLSIRNMREIPTGPAEEELREVNVLMEGEHLVMAFQVWGDKLLLSDRRIIYRDVPLIGRQVRYLTIPFFSIKAFAVKTGGIIDGHMEMGIWTDSTSSVNHFGTNFKRNHADIFRIKRYLDEHILVSL